METCLVALITIGCPTLGAGLTALIAGPHPGTLIGGAVCGLCAGMLGGLIYCEMAITRTRTPTTPQATRIPHRTPRPKANLIARGR